MTEDEDGSGSLSDGGTVKDAAQMLGETSHGDILPPASGRQSGVHSQSPLAKSPDGSVHSPGGSSRTQLRRASTMERKSSTQPAVSTGIIPNGTDISG